MMVVAVVLMALQLYKAEEVAQQRSSCNIGIEEFLFIMRRDKVCNSSVMMLMTTVMAV